MKASNTSQNEAAAGLVHAEAGFATAGEAARFLHISRAMVHKLVGEGRLPARRFGRAVRVPWSWLRTQAVAPETATPPAEARL